MLSFFSPPSSEKLNSLFSYARYGAVLFLCYAYKAMAEHPELYMMTCQQVCGLYGDWVGVGKSLQNTWEMKAYLSRNCPVIGIGGEGITGVDHFVLTDPSGNQCVCSPPDGDSGTLNFGPLPFSQLNIVQM